MRAFLRILALLAVTFLLAPIPLVATLAVLGSEAPSARVGAWSMHLWAKICCCVLGVRTRATGPRPRGACLVTSNHLSYLDILVLGSLYPSVFLSMAEVARWPLIGSLSRLVGTLFIQRKNPADVDRIRNEMARRLALGMRVTFFPEAHTSRGAEVARFHSALLEVAAQRKTVCVPVSLSYDTPGAERPPSLSVCWWGETPFTTHFRELLRLKLIEASVQFGAPVFGRGDRKELAQALEQQVRSRFIPVRQSQRV
jgi:1-acyl-sn-glycerol-3-phosphate acyltransferase